MTVSNLRPIEELVDPEAREFRTAFERMMAKLHAMTPEQRLEYRIQSGKYHPEGEPIGMPYPGDYGK